MEWKKPPNQEAARIESSSERVERWSIQAAKTASYWRYRITLFRNPANTVRGRHYLAQQVWDQLTDAEKAQHEAEKPLWEAIRRPPPAKKTEAERRAEDEERLEEWRRGEAWR